MARQFKGDGFTVNWFGDDILRQIEENLEPGLWAGGNFILGEAQAGAPVRSSNLVNSGYVSTEKRSSYRKVKRGRKPIQAAPRTAAVAFSAFYANLFEDSGAKAHIIRPRRSKVLYMRGIGFRRGARHPGIRPRPFLAPALERNRERIATVMVAATAKGLR